MIGRDNLRDLLTGIGVGQFNATMIVPYLMISPATLDPKAGQSILLVQHVQRALYALGATYVAETGELDDATARALHQVVGDGWEGRPWSASLEAILSAQRRGYRIGVPRAAGAPMAVGGGPLDFLPDVPGGLVTYGVAALLAYHLWFKGRKKS